MQLQNNNGCNSAENTPRNLKRPKVSSKKTTPRNSMIKGFSKKTPLRSKEEILSSIQTQYGKAAAPAPFVDPTFRKEPILKKNLSKEPSCQNEEFKSSLVDEHQIQMQNLSITQSVSRIPLLKKESQTVAKPLSSTNEFEAWRKIKSYMESDKGYREILKKLNKIGGDPTEKSSKKAVIKVLSKFISYYSD